MASKDVKIEPPATVMTFESGKTYLVTFPLETPPFEIVRNMKVISRQLREAGVQCHLMYSQGIAVEEVKDPAAPVPPSQEMHDPHLLAPPVPPKPPAPPLARPGIYDPHLASRPPEED